MSVQPFKCAMVAAGVVATSSIVAPAAQAYSLTTVLTPFTGDDASVLLQLDELDNGNISVTLDVIDTQEEADQVFADFGLSVTPTYADLQGVFFNIEDESLLDGLSIVNYDDSIINAYEFDADSVDSVNGVKLNGGGSDNPCSDEGGCDGGLRIGSNGIGKDDIGTVTWEFSYTDPTTGETGLSLDEFNGLTWGVRATSVGDDDSRNGSTKLAGVLETMISSPTPEDIPEPAGVAALFAFSIGGLTTLRRRGASAQ